MGPNDSKAIPNRAVVDQPFGYDVTCSASLAEPPHVTGQPPSTFGKRFPLASDRGFVNTGNAVHMETHLQSLSKESISNGYNSLVEGPVFPTGQVGQAAAKPDLAYGNSLGPGLARAYRPCKA